MKIFITGATGYLGYHIACQCLAEGHQVLCLRRSTSMSLFDNEQEQCIKWVTINEESLKEIVKTFAPDVLIHAAWGGVRGAGREDADIQKQNIMMSNMLFTLYPYKQIIAIGSQAEYGYYEGPVSEDHELQPIMKYAQAKCVVQHELQSYCEKNHIEWQWIRVFTVFGEKQTGGLGPGVTGLTNWPYNDYYPVVPCGVTDSLGNKSGTVDYTIPAGYWTSGVATIQKVPRYRGIENPFGHIWRVVPDAMVLDCSATGTYPSETRLYVCDNPATCLIGTTAWSEAQY